MTTNKSKAKARLEKLIEIGAPQILIDNFKMRYERTIHQDHYVTMRMVGQKKGHTIFECETVQEAKEFCELYMQHVFNGTTCIVYTNCTSMPLDYWYYVKHMGKVYDSRSRVYRSSKLPETPGSPYTDMWYHVRKLCNEYKYLLTKESKRALKATQRKEA